MGQDLRGYLDAVKRRKPDELHVVSRPIDPAYEITALVVKLEKERRRRPILLFENVKGTKFPVLTNVHASRSRLALALNCAPDAMLTTYLRAMDKPIPPRVVDAAPAQEVVRTGADVDLYALPQIVHHEGDAGPYITSAISFARDPSSDTWNCAYNRLMIQGRDTTSIHLTLGKHLWEFQQIAEQRGEALPLALVIGVHPAIALGALAIGSIDEDERAITWAIATRCQPDRDLTVITNARGSDLDPSTKEDGYTAKWGLDATAKPSLAGYTPRHRVPPEVWERLRLEDFLPSARPRSWRPQRRPMPGASR